MNRDALDLLRTFCALDVRFLLVGAHAVSFYAEPRATGDLDLFVDPAAGNAARVHAALAEFGAPLDDLTVEDLCAPGVVFQMGVAPYRIDVLNQLSGVDFEEAARGAQPLQLGDVAVLVISRSALIKNKQAAGRLRDLLDLELLEKHRPA
ncbi:MAG: hypothetical protein ABI609_17745 [Acidobacteriota bacterium]